MEQHGRRVPAVHLVAERFDVSTQFAQMQICRDAATASASARSLR
jgi:hypothetical protein